MAKNNVQGFGPQKSVVGKYVSDDNSTAPDPIAPDQLMSKKPTDRVSNAAWEDFSIGRTCDDKPRPQVQAHGHGRNEG
jgi:hypothetical protein